MAQSAVQPCSIIKRFDPAEDTLTRCFTTRLPVPIHQLLLQSCTETLGNRIVPAVPCVAHAATDFMTSQRRLKRRAAVLTATIRRQQKTPCTPRRPTAICRPERKTSVDISWLIDHSTTCENTHRSYRPDTKILRLF